MLLYKWVDSWRNLCASKLSQWHRKRNFSVNITANVVFFFFFAFMRNLFNWAERCFCSPRFFLLLAKKSVEMLVEIHQVPFFGLKDSIFPYFIDCYSFVGLGMFHVMMNPEVLRIFGFVGLKIDTNFFLVVVDVVLWYSLTIHKWNNDVKNFFKLFWKSK